MVHGWFGSLTNCSSYCSSGVSRAVQVTMPDHKKSVMLFQSTLLRCHYSTSSSHPVLVQWKYKSFCQDRTEEALGIGKPPSKSNMGGNQYLDCADGSRTVRPVASKLGNSVTLGDFYKGRAVTIVNGKVVLCSDLLQTSRVSPIFKGCIHPRNDLEEMCGATFSFQGFSGSFLHCRFIVKT